MKQRLIIGCIKYCKCIVCHFFYNDEDVFIISRGMTTPTLSQCVIYSFDDILHAIFYFVLKVQYLALRGGLTIKECIHRMMTTLLVHSLQIKISWSGRGQEKVAWGNKLTKKAVNGNFCLFIP